MPRFLLFFALSFQLGAAVSPEFATRRANLRKSIPDGVLVLFGAKESDDLHEAFFQQTDFYYLTGWEQPGAILILTPEADANGPGGAARSRAPREILFLPQRVVSEEKWTGRKLGPDDAEAPAITGVAKVMAAERFESQLHSLLGIYPNLYALASDPAAAALTKLAPLRTVTDARLSIARLRMEKSPAEIAEIQKATDVSIAAHRAVWKTIKPGEYEYQAAALMVSTWMSEGCRRGAYAPIVGSGPNSTTLHYSRNNRRMDAGEVTVIDAAAECDNYASDITRTIPVSGKFTARQREIYGIVLGAQRAAIAAVKPGMTIGRTTPDSLYRIAFDYINSHGKDLKGQPLGAYFNHGLSHHVGLDVHDASDTAAPLKAGMVITIEPGVYIPEENIGIRIEDVVLVTETGAKVLSGALPTAPDEIERALGKAK
ncbi:MAG TPA: aminopeptidase P N-terminal domain-containing protein [Bryobacteraceae bacterium]|nr:aminopeptidase P N-terminal domain-containing protein [Bryobacteraceae bacterium]